ncbi:MAG: HEAT repeat domain-containing protein, partial [Acidobacteriota bacterium]
RLVAALGSYEQPAAIASLVRVLEDGESSTLRVHATRALGHAGVATSARPLLETLATAGDGKLRREIVSALGQIGSPVAQEPLTRLLTATQEPELRARVTVALGSIGGAGAVPALIELLQDEAPAIRFFAVRGLARAEDGRAVAPLAAFYRRLTERHADAAPAEILRRPAPYLADLEMRLEIVRALTRIDPPAARDVLLDAAVPVRFARDSAAALKLNQAAYQLRRAAIFGLGYTRSAAATRFLSSAGGALADRDFRIRSIAVRALGTLSRSEAVAAVLEKLDDKVAEVRWEASLVLGRFADRQAVEPLLARLSDPHPEVRYHAVLGLGYLGDARAAGRIEALLESERSPKVRQAILTTLGLFGQPAVVG